MMKRSLAIVALLAMFGCAAQPQYQWIHPTADQAQFQKDVAQCDYETSAATQGTDYSYRTIFGQELDRSMRKNDLAVKCMVAKGYSKSFQSATTFPAGSYYQNDDRLITCQLPSGSTMMLGSECRNKQGTVTP